MARKKSKKKTHHRRGRVGAVKLNVNSLLQGAKVVLAATGGILAGRLANNYLIPAGASKTTVMAIAAGEVLAGGFGVVKMKTPVMKAVAAGFGASGGLLLTGNRGLAVLPASIGYGPETATGYSPNGMAGYRQVPKVGFPKPNAIGFPKPNAIGATDMERMRTARMYAGIYG